MTTNNDLRQKHAVLCQLMQLTVVGQLSQCIFLFVPTNWSVGSGERCCAGGRSWCVERLATTTDIHWNMFLQFPDQPQLSHPILPNEFFHAFPDVVVPFHCAKSFNPWNCFNHFNRFNPPVMLGGLKGSKGPKLTWEQNSSASVLGLLPLLSLWPIEYSHKCVHEDPARSHGSNHLFPTAWGFITSQTLRNSV